MFPTKLFAIRKEGERFRGLINFQHYFWNGWNDQIQLYEINHMFRIILSTGFSRVYVGFQWTYAQDKFFEIEPLLQIKFFKIKIWK